jgi:hypothetical protein
MLSTKFIHWSGLALLLGVLVPFSPPLPHLVGTVGGVLLGASYIWLGYALWRETAGHSVPSDRMAPVT